VADAASLLPLIRSLPQKSFETRISEIALKLSAQRQRLCSRPAEKRSDLAA